MRLMVNFPTKAKTISAPF